jgi:hypothetical protein
MISFPPLSIAQTSAESEQPKIKPAMKIPGLSRIRMSSNSDPAQVFDIFKAQVKTMVLA